MQQESWMPTSADLHSFLHHPATPSSVNIKGLQIALKFKLGLCTAQKKEPQPNRCDDPLTPGTWLLAGSAKLGPVAWGRGLEPWGTADTPPPT